MVVKHHVSVAAQGVESPGAGLGCELSDVGAENQFGVLWKSIAHTGEPSFRPSFLFPYASKNCSQRGWTLKASPLAEEILVLLAVWRESCFFFRGVVTGW